MLARSALRPLISAPLLIAALALAVSTQLAVMDRLGGADASLRFAIAAAVFAAGLTFARRSGMLRWSEAPATLTSPYVSLPALGASLLLGAVAFASMGGNRFSSFNVTVWMASVSAALWAFWPRTSQWDARLRARLRAWPASVARRLRAPELRPCIKWETVGLLAATLLGTWFLFHRLHEVPPELTSDNAEMLLDLQDVLDGARPIFFPRNTGREPLHFYLNAALAPHIGGVSEMSIKTATAIPAILSMPATFLLGRLLFGSQVGLLAAAIIGVSRWHQILGRWGERTSYLPGAAALLGFFLLRALRDRRRTDFLLAGLTLGVMQHTYLPVRIAPLGVAVCVAIALAIDVARRAPRERVLALLIDSAALVLVAALVFIPLARYGVDNPQSFLFRGRSRLSGDSGDAAINLPLALLENTKNALLMFNWRGDIAWVNNIPGERALDPFSGALFFLGAVYVLFRLVRHRELPLLHVLVLFMVGLLPSIISVAFPQENPGNLRTGMAMPYAVLLAALALVVMARRVRAWVGGQLGTLAAAALVAALFGAIVVTNYDQYFRTFRTQFARSSQRTSYVSGAVNGFVALGGRREDVYIMVWPHWFDLRLVAAQTGSIRWNPGIPNIEHARAKDGLPRPRMYVVHPDDAASRQKLRAWYPGAIEHAHALWETDNRPWFVTYVIPAGARAQDQS